MKFKKVFFTFIVFSFLLPASITAENNVPQAVLDASRSVVNIQVKLANATSAGSGFVVKNDSNITYIARDTVMTA